MAKKETDNPTDVNNEPSNPTFKGPNFCVRRPEIRPANNQIREIEHNYVQQLLEEVKLCCANLKQQKNVHNQTLS